MQKITLLLFLLCCQYVLAQTTLPNGGFELWTTTTYTNPNGWQTLNILSSLGAPVVAFPSPDAHSGNNALQVQTVSFFGNKIPGLCYLGEFDTSNPLNGTKFGKPFSGQPTYLTGYYKYQPNGVDTGGISLQLWRFNPATNKRDTIAALTLTTLETNTSYTYFKIPLEYSQNIMPDSISLVIVSSSSDPPLIGQVGTQLLIDDLALSYEPLGVSALAVPLVAQVAAVSGGIDIALSEIVPTNYQLCATNGQVVAQGTISTNKHFIETKDLPQGIYFCVLNNSKGQGSHYKLWLQ